MSYFDMFHSFKKKKINIGNERDKRVGVMQRESKHRILPDFKSGSMKSRQAENISFRMHTYAG